MSGVAPVGAVVSPVLAAAVLGLEDFDELTALAKPLTTSGTATANAPTAAVTSTNRRQRGFVEESNDSGVGADSVELSIAGSYVAERVREYAGVISLLEGLATTRAIRRYTTDPIPERDLISIVWHASRAPSGSNRQPFRFLVLRQGVQAVAAKSLLGDAFRSSWALKQQSDGYAPPCGLQGPGPTGSEAVDSRPKARMAATMQHYVDHFEETPVVVLVCLQRYRNANPFEGASVYPACQNLLLAARALGYGGALTMWHQMVDAELRILLSIPENVALSACITLGRPMGSHGPVRRRPIGELVFEDGWGQTPEWAVDPPGTAFTQAGPRQH